MSGFNRGADFVEVLCGCTSHRYGDAVGRLKVFASGDLEISCDCTPGCQEDKLTPAAFEKHSGRETARKWKSNVWIIVKGDKVPLSKTVLLKYYNLASKGANGSHKGPNGRLCHRDEFICCKRCNKERRFRLRTNEECRSYHDAVRNATWECSNLTFDRGKMISVAIELVAYLYFKGFVCRRCYLKRSPAMMKRSEQVVKFCGDARDLRPARGAQHVFALDARYAVSQIAAVRPVLISLAILKAKLVRGVLIYRPWTAASCATMALVKRLFQVPLFLLMRSGFRSLFDDDNLLPVRHFDKPTIGHSFHLLFML
ncbi:hypothetical protein ZIOFF_075704 [Zingiber officinale]|uniref:SAND domain-containing protein n=1 Tax=Zingiber officinale TaxID=94328 RepID=A0A8J5BSY2_ZINOF|nr:hypothetical protein ZIOFF_075704 [Zingiber officinale]